MNFMFIRARYKNIQLIKLQRNWRKSKFSIFITISRRVAMVWNDMQWYSYSLPFLLMQTFWMDTHWMDWWDTCWTDMYWWDMFAIPADAHLLNGYALKWIRIAWIRIGGIRVEGKGIGGIRIGGIGFEWICVQNRCKPFEWIRIEWIRTGGIRVERIRIGGIRIGGIRIGGIRFEWICVGYVWCAGYVWDMCGVRYANNLLKNPATKRLSGKIKNGEYHHWMWVWNCFTIDVGTLNFEVFGVNESSSTPNVKDVASLMRLIFHVPKNT